MTSFVLIIKFRNNTIGVYNDIDIALDYIYSLLNTRMISVNDNIIIEKIKMNSYIVLEELTVDLKYIIKKKTDINYIQDLDKTIYEDDYEEDSVINTSIEESDSEDSSIKRERNKKFIIEQNKLGQEKIFITHELNLLKEKKKRLEEEENVYKNDLELFYKFKSLKNNDSKFEIPFMFTNKYLIFKELEENDSLTFDNFKSKYVPDQIITSYDNLFGTTKVENESFDNEVIFTNVSNDELLDELN